MATIFEREINKNLVELYNQAFEDLAIKEIKNACRIWVKKGKRFPYPADLIELCDIKETPKTDLKNKKDKKQ